MASDRKCWTCRWCDHKWAACCWVNSHRPVPMWADRFHPVDGPEVALTGENCPCWEGRKDETE